ncbi:MAG TPA: hypothetical protein VGI12_18005 [Vicinamibacterales bacterium]
MTHRSLSAISLGVLLAGVSSPAQTRTDEYTHYELLPPSTSAVKVTYEASATTEGARTFVDDVAKGARISDVVVHDMMTGQPLAFRVSPASIAVTLARPVPPRGQGRVRIEKTVADPKAYTRAGEAGTFTVPLGAGRHDLVLPEGYQLTGCNIPVRILAEADGRTKLDLMNVAPGTVTLVVTLRAGALTGDAAKPAALTNNRSWEPPPTQGPTERQRLAERAHLDRDIVYFLQEPATHAFSLYHDYTESRPGVDKYINIVRGGSRSSDPSAYILDTGEALRHETLRGAEITAKQIDIGEPVTPQTEIVASYFEPVKPGQSIRLRLSETYTAPESYRLDGHDLVFERSLGRTRNSVVLPDGWYLTASSIPAVVSETPDHRVRLDFVNNRPDSLDVYIKGRQRPLK